MINHFIKDEKGAASVVEAAFIYPVIIISVIFLIYAGVYSLESVLLQSKADSVAMAASRSISFPGYSELRGEDILSFEDKPSVAAVRKSYEKLQPYRYLSKGKTDSRFSSVVSEYASGLFFNSSDIKCTVKAENHILNSRINVTVEKCITMPQLFDFIGFEQRSIIKAYSSSVVSDPAEFVRNTDLTAMAAEYIDGKYQISDKLSEFRSKLKDLTE